MTKVEKLKLLDEFKAIALSYGVPEDLCGELGRYYLLGVPPGSYMEAVLTRDLDGVMSYGTDESITGLRPLYKFCYNHLPGDCWGNKERFQGWIAAPEKNKDGIEDLLQQVCSC